MGNPTTYTDQDGNEPLPPEGGWLPATADSDYGAFLVYLIRNGDVKPVSELNRTCVTIRFEDHSPLALL